MKDGKLSSPFTSQNLHTFFSHSTLQKHKKPHDVDLSTRSSVEISSRMSGATTPPPISLHDEKRDKLNFTKFYQTIFAPSKLREIQKPGSSYRIYFRFKLIKAMNVNIFVFLDVTPCILTVYRRFRRFATVSVRIP